MVTGVIVGSDLNAAEFEELYRETAPQLFGYLRRRKAVEPGDIVAEVYAIAWRRRSDLPAPRLRRAWLYGTARRLLLAEGRKREQERTALMQASEQSASSSWSPSDRYISGTNHPPERELEQTVAAALERLEPDDRELIRLVEWECLSPAEIAVALGIRPGTARVRLHRARRTLAKDPSMRAALERRRTPEVEARNGSS